jgi:hypothetical protein
MSCQWLPFQGQARLGEALLRNYCASYEPRPLVRVSPYRRSRYTCQVRPFKLRYGDSEDHLGALRLPGTDEKLSALQVGLLGLCCTPSHFWVLRMAVRVSTPHEHRKYLHSRIENRHRCSPLVQCSALVSTSRDQDGQVCISWCACLMGLWADLSSTMQLFLRFMDRIQTET